MPFRQESLLTLWLDSLKLYLDQTFDCISQDWLRERRRYRDIPRLQREGKADSLSRPECATGSSLRSHQVQLRLCALPSVALDVDQVRDRDL